LPVGQPDGAPARRQLGVRMARPELVEDGSVGLRDGVAGTRRRESPAVQDHQADRRHRERPGPARPGHATAAATMAANVSGSRLAPPTSAPSTSGSASSSAALSVLTLPPYWMRTCSARSPYLSRTSAR